MPLNLLPKKSWHVGNAANIARVRRDEAAAAAAERAQQDADNRQRLRRLRGDDPEIPTNEDETVSSKAFDQGQSVGEGSRQDLLGREFTYGDVERGRKRRHGEDDTDRDMRYAKRRMEMKDAGILGHERQGRRERKRDEYRDAPLVDETGHIALFPGAERRDDRGQARKKGDREEKKAFDGTMRFADAEGRGGRSWDVAGRENDGNEAIGRDVWGNEDPGRKIRDQKRTLADDPLAAMMKGVQQVRKVEAERKKWKNDRDSELRALKREQRQRSGAAGERLSGNRSRQEDDDIDEFSLDAPENNASTDIGNRRIRGGKRRDERHSHRHDHRRDRRHEDRHTDRGEEKAKRLAEMVGPS